MSLCFLITLWMIQEGCLKPGWLPVSHVPSSINTRPHSAGQQWLGAQMPSHPAAVWLWTSYVTSLGLQIPIYKTEIIKHPLQTGCCRNEVSQEHISPGPWSLKEVSGERRWPGKGRWVGQLEGTKQARPCSSCPESIHLLETSAKARNNERETSVTDRVGEGMTFQGQIGKVFVSICERMQSPVVILMTIVFIHLHQGR